MLKLPIPLLHASDSAAAEDFYCNRLGFQREFAHRAVEAKADPRFSARGVSGGVVNLLVEDVDARTASLSQKGVRIDTGPVDKTWGTREMYIKDADGNCVRFIGSKNSAPLAGSARAPGR
jgi:uncharacterized glyoxalase superfamily protein PhnB